MDLLDWAPFRNQNTECRPATAEALKALEFRFESVLPRFLLLEQRLEGLERRLADAERRVISDLDEAFIRREVHTHVKENVEVFLTDTMARVLNAVQNELTFRMGQIEREQELSKRTLTQCQKSVGALSSELQNVQSTSVNFFSSQDGRDTALQEELHALRAQLAEPSDRVHRVLEALADKQQELQANLAGMDAFVNAHAEAVDTMLRDFAEVQARLAIAAADAAGECARPWFEPVLGLLVPTHYNCESRAASSSRLDSHDASAALLPADRQPSKLGLLHSCQVPAAASVHESDGHAAVGDGPEAFALAHLGGAKPSASAMLVRDELSDGGGHAQLQARLGSLERRVDEMEQVGALGGTAPLPVRRT